MHFRLLHAIGENNILVLQWFKSREAPTAFSVMDAVAICYIFTVVRIEPLIRITVVQACNEIAIKMTL